VKGRYKKKNCIKRREMGEEGRREGGREGKGEGRTWGVRRCGRWPSCLVVVPVEGGGREGGREGGISCE